MGRLGSGRHWHFSANDTTDDYRAIDVRRWQREGLLTPGRVFGSQWSRNGEVVASIQVHVETDRVCLIYRHRSASSEWKDENYPVWLDWTPCSLGGPGARRAAVGGAWRFSMAAASSPVVIATGWPIPASVKPGMVEPDCVQTESGRS